MEKELTWLVSYDLASLVNKWNKFIEVLGHYKILFMKFLYINEKFNVIIVHQKLN